MSNDQDNKWKQKYLRGLDELEQKEKQWRALEELLRRALGRLAHTGYGIDHSLDKKLDRVRDAVRKKHEASTLERLVREASDAAVSVQESTQKAGAEAGQALADLVERLPLNGAPKKQAEQLCKSLKRATGMDQIQPLLGEASALVAQAGTQPSDNPAIPQAEGRRGGGLLGRLLGTGGTTPAAPSSSQPLESARTMAHFLEQLEPAPVWAERLASLREQAAACQQERELYRLLDEAAAVLSEILQTEAQSESAAGRLEDALPAAGQALLELVEKIEIPQQLQERAGTIKNALAGAATANQVRVATQSVAELLAEIRRLVQDEKKDLEKFLEGVTNRIRNLSEHVAELGHNRQASSDGHATMHDAFQDHMARIRTSVRETDDAAILKQAIETGLDAIEEQMEQYARQEENLSREAEERIADLSSRLHDMKHEAWLLQQQMQQQRELALKDPLTGAYNRLAYEERIEDECGRWRRYGEPLSLLILDVDHFKRVNDSLGHLAGDKALKAMAVRLLQNVREVDFVARYGGEEFVVVMPNTTLEQAFGVAEKLRGMVAAAGFHYNKQPVSITVSCGVAGFREGDEPGNVFGRADDALYAAKQAGRNCTKREQAPG